MCHKLFSIIALCLLGQFALADTVQREDQLVWDYGEFVDAFSAMNWSSAARFIRPDTKIGFGGDVGAEGLVSVFGRDEVCHKAMLRALEQGCRKTGKGDAMQCLSPPHYERREVVYLGARASFKYNKPSALWMLEYLICGGD